jgi:hypothetical protein
VHESHALDARTVAGKWRNAAQHGVNGVSWSNKPEGGGSRNVPKLPERAEIKQVINFIDALMLQLERASSEKPVERASTPPPAEALAEAPPTGL